MFYLVHIFIHRHSTMTTIKCVTVLYPLLIFSVFLHMDQALSALAPGTLPRHTKTIIHNNMTEVKNLPQLCLLHHCRFCPLLQTQGLKNFQKGADQLQNSRKRRDAPVSNLQTPLLDIYPKKTIIQNGIYTPMLTAALFTIARRWKKPKCPTTEECIKNMQYIHIYNGILLSHKK